MKVIYLGTPEFALEPLKSIYLSRHEIVGVVCQADRLGNRNKVEISPVKRFALEKNLPLFQFEKISKEGVEPLKALNADVMVTCAYGQILSQAVLTITPKGVINVHGSLLPKLRGAAPIQQAILDGEEKTGVTILQTVYEVDAGDMLLSEELKIDENESYGELSQRLSNLGAKLIVEALDKLEEGTAVFTPQNAESATFTKKITKENEKIDWTKTNVQVRNLVRALNPNPVAWTEYKGKRLKVYRVSLCGEINCAAKAGDVVYVDKKTVKVACGEGCVCLDEVQAEGSKRLTIAQFLCGNKIEVGDSFR